MSILPLHWAGLGCPWTEGLLLVHSPYQKVPSPWIPKNPDSESLPSHPYIPLIACNTSG